MKRKLISLALAFCMITVTAFSGLLSADVRAEERDKAEDRNTFTYDMVLIEGATLSWDVGYDPVTRSIEDKSVVSVSYNEDDWKYLFTGLKAGSTVVTFDDYSTDYVFNIKVLSKKSVQSKADKLLKAKIKKLKKKTRYIYQDINGDGVKDLVTSTKFYYYNYRDGKIKYRSHKSYKDIYLSSDKKTLYCTFNKSYYCKYMDDSKKSEFKRLGYFARWDDHYIMKYDNDSCDSGFMQYTSYGKKVYGAKKDYVYHDSGYDQDDYQYIDFNKTTMTNMIKGSSIPAGIQMKMVVKGAKKLTWKKR